ncbi:hypothetical protein [Clostridium akagii]|uniref:hypothetical protein n=1 Tax=Clostridium akagii TaxID=91623 RepID=UPI00047A5EF0|nr:hypothetical protein [Clostridium akagii]
MIYKSLNFRDKGFAKEIYDNGIKKSSMLIDSIFNEYIVMEEEKDFDNLIYRKKILYKGINNTIEYKFEDIGEDEKQEIVNIYADNFKTIDVKNESFSKVSNVLMFVENMYHIDLLPLDIEEKNTNVISVVLNEKFFKANFFIDSKYIRVTYNKDFPEFLSIFERNSQIINLE